VNPLPQFRSNNSPGTHMHALTCTHAYTPGVTHAHTYFTLFFSVKANDSLICCTWAGATCDKDQHPSTAIACCAVCWSVAVVEYRGGYTFRTGLSVGSKSTFGLENICVRWRLSKGVLELAQSCPGVVVVRLASWPVWLVTGYLRRSAALRKVGEEVNIHVLHPPSPCGGHRGRAVGVGAACTCGGTWVRYERVPTACSVRGESERACKRLRAAPSRSEQHHPVAHTLPLPHTHSHIHTLTRTHTHTHTHTLTRQGIDSIERLHIEGLLRGGT